MYSAAADLPAGTHTAHLSVTVASHRERWAKTLLTGKCYLKVNKYTRQQLGGLSHIFTLALQWMHEASRWPNEIFIHSFMFWLEEEERRRWCVFATGPSVLSVYMQCNAKSSYPPVCPHDWLSTVLSLLHRKSLADCVIKPEKES